LWASYRQGEAAYSLSKYSLSGSGSIPFLPLGRGNVYGLLVRGTALVQPIIDGRLRRMDTFLRILDLAAILIIFVAFVTFIFPGPLIGLAVYIVQSYTNRMKEENT
jgi:hypothetical protein